MKNQTTHITLDQLSGVGLQTALKLAKLGLHTVSDLLFHLPSRYEDRTQIVPIRSIRPGDHVMIEGQIGESQMRSGRRRSLLCVVQDATGFITLRFFYFTLSQQTQFSRQGIKIRCFGEVRMGMNGYEMVHPEYRIITAQTPLPVSEHLTPVYPTTEGLQQSTFRQLTEQALKHLHQITLLEELLPDPILQQFSMPELASALHYVHRPPPNAPRDQLLQGKHPAQQRLAFEELLAHQLSLQRQRTQLYTHSAPVLSKSTASLVRRRPMASTLGEDSNHMHSHAGAWERGKGEGIKNEKWTALLLDSFLDRLPFTLTSAQQQVIQQIQHDLERSIPMLRLVQGDVGSGKTVVAAIAALQAIAHGYQVTLMAPTELLAEQHAKQFFHWFEPLGIHSACLTGSLKSSVRNILLSEIQSGAVQMILGTHALFQKEVYFKKLGLVIIDEQHRFGVQQRLELREKGRQDESHPHQLFMSATPIPRTLAMTAYADLDFSNLDELPPGRKPITTVLISQARRDAVVTQIAKACAQGRQAYWVCTLIEESEFLQCQAAETTRTLLGEQLPHLRLGLIHGRLKPTEKEQIMLAFKAGEIDLLVATTVIEVGVDVPNSSLMIIENAERLGLAQLHQLRGRVGRGKTDSYCVLLYQTPLSQLAKERLQVLKNHQDGFEIARKDLELRGPGDVLGTRQSGLIDFKIADLLRDKELLPSIHQASQLLWETFPEQIEPLISRWKNKGDEYGRV